MNPRANSRVPKVAVVVPDFRVAGGAQELAIRLYEVMANTGRFEPTLVSLATSRRDEHSRRALAPATWLQPARAEKLEWEGRPIIHVGAEWAEIETQRYRPRAALRAVLAGFDLVQVVAGTPAWACAAAGAGRPLLLQVASMAAVERQTRIQNGSLLSRLGERFKLALMVRDENRGITEPDVLLVMNEWLDRLARERRGAKRTVFAPPGIDTMRFTPPPAGAVRDCILSVGRLGDSRKGFRHLFRAYAELRKTLPACPPLVVAGTGDLPEAEREFLRDSALDAHVEIRRDVSKGQLVGLYQRAALFVLASDEEGFGFVIVEAMACATPVVSTACGGPNLIVADGVTGLLVPVGDSSALAEAMRRCLAEPALARHLGAAGRARAVEVYSQEAAAERVFAEYERLLCPA